MNTFITICLKGKPVGKHQYSRSTGLYEQIQSAIMSAFLKCCDFQISQPRCSNCCCSKHLKYFPQRTGKAVVALTSIKWITCKYWINR